MGPIVLIIGTRPEGIKMMPIYFSLKNANIPAIICSTTQHRQLLSEVYASFQVAPDIELDIMRPGQDLFYVTQEVLGKTKELFQTLQPSLVLVQGDTTSAMAAAMAAFYLKIPIGHVEAGLRSYHIDNPFPEEFNRRAITLIARYHFSPTVHAVENLVSEKVEPSHIFFTGNTVVDALRIMQELIEQGAITVGSFVKELVQKAEQNYQQLVLVTTHRRESFGQGTRNILLALKECALNRKNVLFFYPFHPNPAIAQTLDEIDLHAIDNIILSEPINYSDMIYLLSNTHWVATDSGGLCEEAVSLQKPVVILRNETERIEAVLEKKALLIGTEKEPILQAMYQCIENKNSATKNTLQNSIFGDGYAAEKIIGIIKNKAQY